MSDEQDKILKNIKDLCRDLLQEFRSLDDYGEILKAVFDFKKNEGPYEKYHDQVGNGLTEINLTVIMSLMKKLPLSERTLDELGNILININEMAEACDRDLTIDTLNELKKAGKIPQETDPVATREAILENLEKQRTGATALVGAIKRFQSLPPPSAERGV